jgi:hypothetical protein
MVTMNMDHIDHLKIMKSTQDILRTVHPKKQEDRSLVEHSSELDQGCKMRRYLEMVPIAIA